MRRLLRQRVLFDWSVCAPVALRAPEADGAAPERRRLVPRGLSRLDRVAEGNGLRGADSHGFEAEVIFHDEDHLFSAGAKTWMNFHLRHFCAPGTYPLCCGALNISWSLLLAASGSSRRVGAGTFLFDADAVGGVFVLVRGRAFSPARERTLAGVLSDLFHPLWRAQHGTCGGVSSGLSRGV